MIKKTLNGQWQMCEAGEGKWMPADIPGSVVSTLLNSGQIPDPYVGLNEYAVRDLMEKDYIFERSFSLTDEMLQKPKLVLVCAGLDTIADIYINGRLVGNAYNMHRTWRYDIKKIAASENVVKIVFHSPIQYINRCAKNAEIPIDYTACGAMDNNQYIRKAHSMFGWDWGIQLPDMGIWRDIYVEAYEARLLTAEFEQIHADGVVTLKTRVLTEDADQAQITVTLKSPDGQVIESQKPGKDSDTVKMTIHNPKLWWPNDMGAHLLYTVCIELAEGSGRVAETKTYRIGLRTLTVCRDEDQWGKNFALEVNGVKIFTKGANYIPEDAIYSRITKKRQADLIKAAAKSHFNCLRIWGGGYYPSDEFYDLCDENGIIVWQDMMFACNIYDLSEDFEQNIIEEIRENVVRLKHHASLGLFCGNNEMESGWYYWPEVIRNPVKFKADYIKIFEYIIPKIIKKNAPGIFYWPSSPSSGGSFDHPDDESNGDCHYWDVWHGQKPFKDYRNHFFRFCSEFGFQSFPSIKTIRTFAKPEEENIFSQVMESHQKNGSANGKILYYLSENYQYPKDFESLVYVSQILQGTAIKYGVEHWRSHRGRCMGALYWQFNDNWPVASWSGIDYYGRWKMLQYMAVRFFAPKLGTLFADGTELTLSAVNDTMQDCDVNVTVHIKDMDLNVLKSFEMAAKAKALSAYQFDTVDVADVIKGRENQVFAEAIFEFSDGYVMKQTVIFVKYKYLKLKKPDISVSISRSQEKYQILLSADTFVPYIFLDFKENDALFDDNGFFITDKNTYCITAEVSLGQEMTEETLRSQLIIRHLYDSIR